MIGVRGCLLWHQCLWELSGSLRVWYYIDMGTICLAKEGASRGKSESEKDKSVVKIEGVNSQGGLRLQVSRDKLIHVSAELLVLFMDHTTNLRRHDHFLQLPVQGLKLQEHAVAFLQKHKLADPDPSFITFSIIIPTLNFSRASILFCRTWKEDPQAQAAFKRTLRDYFHSISTHRFSSLAVAEFTSELGVPLQRGARRIVREIVRWEHKPDLIQFCCLSEESKAVFLQAITSNRQDLQRSVSTARTKSNQQSDYF